ncbi:hypothetical protein K439DRAFT_1615895 [Ramaria rubella]|nr:hypothetical protein K439DRAFT_1615895 [Ramaria rubella]
MGVRIPRVAGRAYGTVLDQGSGYLAAPNVRSAGGEVCKLWLEATWDQRSRYVLLCMAADTLAPPMPHVHAMAVCARPPSPQVPPPTGHVQGLRPTHDDSMSYSAHHAPYQSKPWDHTGGVHGAHAIPLVAHGVPGGGRWVQAVRQHRRIEEHL